MRKKWQTIYRKLKHVREFDEHERILFARSLAATPDERWQMNVAYLRSLGLWGRSGLKKFASNSYLEQTLKARRASGRTR